MWARKEPANSSGKAQGQDNPQFVLNCNFYSWVHKEIRTNPNADWSTAVSQYLDYAKKINENSMSFMQTPSISQTQPQSLIQPQPLATKQTQNLPFLNSTQNQSNQEDNEEVENTEPEAPPVQKEINDEGTDEQNVYQTVCALYCFKGEWKPFGKGTFKLNIEKLNPNKARILFRLDSGKKLVLNASLYKGMKVERKGKKDVIFSAQNYGTDQVKGLQQFLLREAAADRADAAKEEIEKRIPK